MKKFFPKWFVKRLLILLIGREATREVIGAVKDLNFGNLSNMAKRDTFLRKFANLITSEHVLRLVLELVVFLVKRGGKL